MWQPGFAKVVDSIGSRPHVASMRLLLVLLHLYVAARLLPPLETWAQAAGAAMVIASLWLIPKGWWVPKASPRKVMARWIAMGFFSWLFVLTVARDVALAVVRDWTAESALAVLIATPL